MNPLDLASKLPGTEVITAPELTVVVPTFNERANIPLLVDQLQGALAGIKWETIFVDDNSPDGTAAVAKAIGESDGRVRCIRRVGRRGLAGACIEGMLASNARYVAVMDADLQHDERVLGEMLQQLRKHDCDLAIGSRYLTEGCAAGLSRKRLAWSRAGTVLARRILRVEVTDPLSGFFMMRREVVEKIAPKLSVEGFKILA